MTYTNRKTSLFLLRIAAIALATLCIVLALGKDAHAETAGMYTYEIEDGKATIITCDKDIADSVEIPAELGECPVTRIGTMAFSGCVNLTGIELPPSVTRIDDSAFLLCTQLTEVKIPDSVTSIGAHAFKSCYGLSSVTIPGSVTSIGNHAFANCTGLTSISLPPELAAIGDWTFFNCPRLGSIEIPSSVTNVGDYAFSDCESLASVIIPDSVTNMGASAFEGCTSLASVALSTSAPRIGDNAFKGCESLTSIVIPDSVVEIGDRAFSGCESLANVAISASVYDIGDGAFANCTGLEGITVAADNEKYSSQDGVLLDKAGQILRLYPSNSSKYVYVVPDTVTTIVEGAFTDCKNLTGIIIPESVLSIDANAFEGCDVKDVYFTGSQERWAELQGAASISGLASSTVHPNASGKIKKIEKVEPTCDAPGTNAYFDLDGKYFEDEDCSKPIADLDAWKSDPNKGLIPATGHQYKKIAGVAPTCTSTGWSDGYVCEVCGHEIARKQLAKTDHTPVKMPALEPTTGSEGLTEGSKCSVCGTILKPQEIIKRLPSANPPSNGGSSGSGSSGGSGKPGTSGSTSIKFVDVNAKTPHADDIKWMASKGISEGWTVKGKRYFRGTEDVTRQDMAAFLHRLASLAGIKAKKTQKLTFSDVNSKTPHAADIRWLAATGISTGWKVGKKYQFRGMETVKRQDMAAFMYRLADLSNDGKLNNNAKSGSAKLKFSDVKAKTPHAKEIKWMASHGITTGWKVGKKYQFRGMETVKRQDMAAFMHRLNDKMGKY